MSNYAAVRRLVTDLRAHGFPVGVVEEQRVVELLLRLHEGGVELQAEQLCRMLGSVLCCTAEQQNRFPARFEAHFAAVQPRPEPPPPPPPPPLPPRVAPGVLETWRAIPWQEQREIIKRLVITVVMAAFFFTAMYRLLPHRNQTETQTQTQTQIQTPSFMEQQLQQGANALLRAAGEQTSSYFESILRGPRAVWDRFGSVLGPFTFFTFTAPFLFAGLWVVAPGLLRAGYLSRREVRARPSFLELLATARQPDILGQHASARKLQPLRRPRTANSREIDVDACIPRMLANGGYFEPVFRQRLLAPEYLVLIDRRGPEDHIAMCGEALVQAMRAANVYVDRYWFDRDPRRLFRIMDAPALSLDEVAGRHSEHRLILIASGERLLDPTSGALHPWAQLLRQFERRIMLTPAAPALWGFRERALFAGLAIPVVPLSADSIDEVVEILGAEEPSRPGVPLPPPASAAAAAKVALADLLEERTSRWMLASPPSTEEQDELVPALRNALSDPQWRWLCACAVYPQLVWRLTLFLARGLLKQERNPRPLFDELVVLGGLPWFRTGELPVWLRERLTQSMSDDEYRLVQRSLSELLQTTLEPRAGDMMLIVGDDRAKETAGSKLKDEVLIDFLSRAPSQRTSVPLSDKVASRFGRRPEAKGLLRPMFSRRRGSEIRQDALLIAEMLSDAGAVIAEVRPAGADGSVGRDYRTIAGLRTKSGDRIAASGLAIYLPPGNRVAYIVNDWTADLHCRNRRLATWLGFCNLALVVLSLLIFYNGSSETNVGFHVALAMAWIAVPFLALFVGLVAPIAAQLSAFPKVTPLGQTRRHMARVFSIKGL